MADALLKVHVTPRGSRNEITGWRDDVLCIKLTAPPVEEAANAALVKFLADALGVRKSRITLVAGKISREKTLEIVGLSDDEITTRLRV